MLIYTNDHIKFFSKEKRKTLFNSMEKEEAKKTLMPRH
jgi:hypothetical protein